MFNFLTFFTVITLLIAFCYAEDVLAKPVPIAKTKAPSKAPTSKAPTLRVGKGAPSAPSVPKSSPKGVLHAKGAPTAKKGKPGPKYT